MSKPEDYQARTRRKLQQIVEDAASQPPMFAPVEMREVGLRAIAGLRVVWRCHPNLAEPDECEQAILQLLYQAGRLRSKQILATLTETFAKSTIERRLGRLVRLGVLRHFTEAPRGYDLDPWLRGQAEIAANNCA